MSKIKHNFYNYIMKKVLFLALVVAASLSSCNQTSSETGNAADSLANALVDQLKTEVAAAPVVDVSSAVDLGVIFNDLRGDFDARVKENKDKTILFYGVVSDVTEDAENPSITLKAANPGDKWDAATVNFAAGTDLSEVNKFYLDETQEYVVTVYAEGVFSETLKLNTTGRPVTFTNAKLLKVEPKAAGADAAE